MNEWAYFCIGSLCTIALLLGLFVLFTFFRLLRRRDSGLYPGANNDYSWDDNNEPPIEKWERNEGNESDHKWNERLSGDSTTGAPPPEGKKKKGKGK